jgi:hypothetical protein
MMTDDSGQCTPHTTHDRLSVTAPQGPCIGTGPLHWYQYQHCWPSVQFALGRSDAWLRLHRQIGALYTAHVVTVVSPRGGGAVLLLLSLMSLTLKCRVTSGGFMRLLAHPNPPGPANQEEP